MINKAGLRARDGKSLKGLLEGPFGDHEIIYFISINHSFRHSLNCSARYQPPGKIKEEVGMLN
jgi:hypothetical protein